MLPPKQLSAMEILAKVADLLAVNGKEGGRSSAAGLGALRIADLMAHNKSPLTDAARLLKIKGFSAMRKDDLAKAVRTAIKKLSGAATDTDQSEDQPTEEDRIARSKFDLGQKNDEPKVEHIPWGYGYNRITAMVINPDQLFAYWEVTDDAIDTARQALGTGGGSAWLNLRLYDVTGRIFDGTNAHSYTDYKVERSDRQWFIHVGKPTSTHCVEIGLKSYEGFFVKIARSGRIDFPRREPVADAPVAWLTVRSVTGAVEPAPAPATHWGGGWSGPGAPSPGGGGHEGHFHGAGGGGGGGEAPGGTAITWHEEGWHTTTAVMEREWVEERSSFEWLGPMARTSWQSGPFPLQVEAPGRVEERFDGGVTVYAIAGGKRVTFGPWQVVIRGLHGWAEGRVLGTWEVHKSWATDGGLERWGERTVFGKGGFAGGSELLGASERRWLAGSELRLGGASEIYRLGASEILYGGASELQFRGASEYRYSGASEWQYRGASEWTYRGGSENFLGGASEQRFLGGSEGFHGASEGWLGGGDDRGWGGASDYRPPGGNMPPEWPTIP